MLLLGGFARLLTVPFDNKLCQVELGCQNWAALFSSCVCIILALMHQTSEPDEWTDSYGTVLPVSRIIRVKLTENEEGSGSHGGSRRVGGGIRRLEVPICSSVKYHFGHKLW